MFIKSLNIRFFFKPYDVPKTWRFFRTRIVTLFVQWPYYIDNNPWKIPKMATFLPFILFLVRTIVWYELYFKCNKNKICILYIYNRIIYRIFSHIFHRPLNNYWTEILNYSSLFKDANFAWIRIITNWKYCSLFRIAYSAIVNKYFFDFGFSHTYNTQKILSILISNLSSRLNIHLDEFGVMFALQITILTIVLHLVCFSYNNLVKYSTIIWCGKLMKFYLKKNIANTDYFETISKNVC